MEEPKQHQILTTRHAHFYTLGTLNADEQRIWIVIHGYGQMARFFIRKFGHLSDKGDFIIAPEGLSKYYLNDGSGRVGASWMTKENRLDEIEDQINYLDQIVEDLDLKNKQLNVLGFSQGVSTVFRWVSKGKVYPDKVVFWSGRLPDEDVEKDFTDLPVTFVYGDDDEFLHLMNEEEQKEILKRNFPNFKLEVFKGKHVITSELLEKYA